MNNDHKSVNVKSLKRYKREYLHKSYKYLTYVTIKAKNVEKCDKNADFLDKTLAKSKKIS